MVATEPETTPKAEITPEELLAMPDGGHFELIEGELKEAASECVIEFHRIGVHCHSAKQLPRARLGPGSCSRARIPLFPVQTKKVRRADVTFIRRDRYSWQQLTQGGFMTIPPDLAVEEVSPNDVVDELEEKIEEHLRAGVKACLGRLLASPHRAGPSRTERRGRFRRRTSYPARTSSPASVAGSTTSSPNRPIPASIRGRIRTGLTISRLINNLVRSPRPSSSTRSAAGIRSMPDPHDTTADHPPRRPTTVNKSSPDSFVPGKRVIEKSGAEMATETRWLLQQRLRAASLVLVVGFGCSLPDRSRSTGISSNRGPCCFTESCSVCSCEPGCAIQPLETDVAPASLVRGRPVFSDHHLVHGRTIFPHAARRARQRSDARVGRGQEQRAVDAGDDRDLCHFYPQHLDPAAKLIIPMALAPMAVPWIVGMVHPELYQVAIRAANFEKISEDGLFLLLGAFTAIFGTHTINTLRIEAYEARQLNQYRLGRKLGGGGMGEVYLAEHQLLKRPCAIKLIRHELAGNQRVFARFEREVRATARLSHWNTIEIFDYGRNDDGAFYYVMEYLPGLSLAALVDRFGPMSPARVIYLLRQACDALREAHDAGLIHRDIKPANLMAAYRGGHYDVTKILDFGLVKTLSEDQSVHISQEGTIAGSPLYMAPEQVMHTQAPDRPTDIYGLGAVAYFTLTGRPPFTGPNPHGSDGRPCQGPGHSTFADSALHSSGSGGCCAPLPGEKPERSLSGYTGPRS